MAPHSLDDDFVLTLSDNERSRSEPEDDPVEQGAATSTSNKKRKRVGGEKNHGTSKLPSKKRQKAAEAEVEAEASSSGSDNDQGEGWAAGGEDDGAMDSDFEFALEDGGSLLDDFDGWAGKEEKVPNAVGAQSVGVSIDDIVARRLADRRNDSATAEGGTDDSFEGFDDEADLESGNEDELLAADGFGMGAASEESGAYSGHGVDEDEAETSDDSDDDDAAMPVAHPDDVDIAASDDDEGKDSDREDPAEVARRQAFFAADEPTNTTSTTHVTSFQSMSLSRPILKGLAAVGFSSPTPIQSKTIPIALLGKDVVGGAVTGSGKTGAFIIPILERLLYRPKKVPTTRVAILMPTRELAVQCFSVATKLAAFTDITFAQIVGGFSVREQENILKQRPDVIIATPGRFIDHMRNTSSFAVTELEILVLDEADRMLEDGFADELNEILTTIPKSRQTMLFSATMTDSVDKLIRVGLNKPVRLMVDAKRATVSGLVQEFVRLRPGREKKRLAYLVHLCKTLYTDRTIIFFRQKKEAHRVRVVFALIGLKAAELHGSMSQEQRIAAVSSFRDGQCNFLLATDLASRGLDIKNVSTVLNYEAPQTHEIYLHRVGRTARAGRTGRACTIAAEPDRKVVKAAVKAGRAQGAKIVSRILPTPEVDGWDAKLTALEEHVDAVLEEEKEQKLLNNVDRDVTRATNIIDHQKEIMSRPRRTWFESEKEKKEAKQAGLIALNPSIKIKADRKKLSNKEKKKLDVKDERTEGRTWKKGKGDAAKVKSHGPGIVSKNRSAAGKVKKGNKPGAMKGKR